MPRWLVLVLVEHDTLDQSFRFVLDLESEHVLACLPTLLSLPVPWVGYDLKDSRWGSITSTTKQSAGRSMNLPCTRRSDGSRR
jgi:hypothetical protein